jgi:hypothetical protein
MSQYITLIGVEEVSRAASRMVDAADRMSQVAANIDGSLERHQRFMDDWLQRFENALAASPSKQASASADQGGE